MVCPPLRGQLLSGTRPTRRQWLQSTLLFCLYEWVAHERRRCRSRDAITVVQRREYDIRARVRCRVKPALIVVEEVCMHLEGVASARTKRAKIKGSVLPLGRRRYLDLTE